MDAEKKRRLLRWGIIVIVVGGGAVGILFHNAATRQREAAEDSARMALEQDVRDLNARRAKAEAAARQAREDSLWTAFASPDLTFHSLRGHVQTVVADGDTLRFSREGRWTNAPGWSADEKPWLSPSYQRQSRWQHNADGYLVRKLEASQMDGEYAVDYAWSGGRLASERSPYGTTTYAYDEDGVPLSATYAYTDADGTPAGGEEVRYSDYRYDDTGNWIERREHRGPKQQTVRRAIAYYPR